MPVLSRRRPVLALLVACLMVLGLLTTATSAAAAPQATVQGRVLDSAGDPLRHFDVSAYARRSDGTWSAVAYAQTDDAGRFSIASTSTGRQPVRLLVYKRVDSLYLEPQYPPWPDYHAPQWIGGGVDWNTPRWWGGNYRTLTDDDVDGTTYALGEGGTSVSGVEVTMTSPAGVIGIDPHSEAGDDQVVEVRYRPEPSADEQTLLMGTVAYNSFVIPEVFPPGSHTVSFRVAGTSSPWRTAVVSVTAGERAVAELVTPNEIGLLERSDDVAMAPVRPGRWPGWRLGEIETSVGATTRAWQWFRGETPIPGATGATLVTPPREGRGTIRVRVTVAKPGYPSHSWFSQPTRAEFPVISVALSRKRVMVARGDSVTVRGRVRMSDGSLLRDFTRNRFLSWAQICPDPELDVGAELNCSQWRTRLRSDDTFRARLPRNLVARKGIYAVLEATRGAASSPVAPLTVTRYRPRVRITANRRSARVGEWVRVRIHVGVPKGVVRDRWRLPEVLVRTLPRRSIEGLGQDGDVVRVKMRRAGTVRLVGTVYGDCGRTYDCIYSVDYLSARSKALTIRVRR